MTSLLRTTERRARYTMGGSAILLLGVMCAFNAGLISRSGTYSLQAWYLVNTSDSYLITTEYGSEDACRRQEQPTKVCRSGAAMMARTLSEQKVAASN